MSQKSPSLIPLVFGHATNVASYLRPVSDYHLLRLDRGLEFIEQAHHVTVAVFFREMRQGDGRWRTSAVVAHAMSRENRKGLGVRVDQVADSRRGQKFHEGRSVGVSG